MTERIYYNEAFVRGFDAQVLSCEPEGGRWRVILDRTAFYPTSGGQPHDLGTLAGASVLEVVDAEDKVVHYTSAAVEVGPVRGEIDWARRIDHMQQHTGQHLLSAAFIELFAFPTVSFHLGREVSTIDLEAPSIVPHHIEQAERRANQIILEDRVVLVRFGTAEELEKVGIRKKVEREGILRAIEVEGFDRQPCGGTHLARTGQAGMLLTRRLERRRNCWRLEFVCGGRALAEARSGYAALTQAASLLSCGLPEVPTALEKLINDRRAQHSAHKRLEERLAEQESHSLLAANPPSAPDAPHVLAVAIQDATPDYLRLLAANLVAEARVMACLASRSSGQVALAQSKGLPGDMGILLREILKPFAGKGGGSRDFAQGTVADPGQIDALLTRAKDAIKSEHARHEAPRSSA